MKICCFCGKKLIFKNLLDGSRERYCPDCDHVFFDSPSPAVIVAVTNAEKILLTRSVGWEHPYWGLIAGHVKSGETAEKAAIREVREEAGLEIFDLKILRTYAKSPDLLMIGFTAKTNIVGIKKSKELENATWFKLDEPLPLRPDAISSHLVNHLLNLKKKGSFPK